MKNWLRLALASTFLMAGAASGQLVDDFSGDLSNYTQTLILDVNGGATNSSAFQINGGALEFDTTFYDDIEQTAFIYDGLTLEVGEELQADIPGTINGSRNLGLYVGGSQPTAGLREDYITIYGGSNPNNQIFSRGFDGVDEYDNPSGNPTDEASITQLFIARTAMNTFEAGFYDSLLGRVIVTERTPFFPNTANFVGFYADVRSEGVLGSFDNLTVVGGGGGGSDGDFDDNGIYDCSDIDALTADIAAGNNTMSFDLTEDGLVTTADLDAWLLEAGEENIGPGQAYLPGDADLNGSVDVSDFNIWNGSKFTNVDAWCQADFNADGVADVGDFNIWNGNKFTSSDTVAVPEPDSFLVLLGAISMLALSSRNRR